MDKKGAEAIVAWVLLVGLSITLGVIVMQWSKEQAEKQAKDIVREVEGDIKCVDVSINAYFTDANCDEIFITNKGYFKILSIKIRPDIGTVETLNINLDPQQSQTLNIGYLTNKLDIIPIIKAGKEDIACLDRKLTINC